MTIVAEIQEVIEYPDSNIINLLIIVKLSSGSKTTTSTSILLL